MNKVPYNLSENSLTIFWEGKPYTLRKDHANFQLARQAILDARYEDLGDLLDIVKSVENFVEGDIEVRDEVVYYKGHRLHGVVVDKLIEMLRAGMKDSAPLVNFITRLQANPSANSVNELYSFLSYKSLATTPDGMVLGYKGVQGDGQHCSILRAWSLRPRPHRANGAEGQQRNDQGVRNPRPEVHTRR